MVLVAVREEIKHEKYIRDSSVHCDVLNEGHRIAAVNLRGMHNSERPEKSVTCSLVLYAFTAIRLH